jgi:hypothetical protein
MLSNKVLATVFAVGLFVLACLEDNTGRHNAAVDDNSKLSKQWYQAQFTTQENRHVYNMDSLRN